MTSHRNDHLPSVPTELARHRILTFLEKVYRLPDGPTRLSAKSQLGYAAFPDYKWGKPQGAAFAVAKIARGMERDGLIRYDCRTVDRFNDWGWRITSAGLQHVAKGPGS